MVLKYCCCERLVWVYCINSAVPRDCDFYENYFTGELSYLFMYMEQTQALSLPSKKLVVLVFLQSITEVFKVGTN